MAVAIYDASASMILSGWTPADFPMRNQFHHLRVADDMCRERKVECGQTSQEAEAA
ncbi:hypothetical protein Van01_55720 [Micromonospora andamanensis]|uniref:Uncharacterized protein n=1 Tax=Micromonospora andamanensis TaxID=1287068 RepID=A0ABQ4I385_9ACTN|nr:hypothetical protein Van01_55720 [Micromonospora andamanensis]